MSNESIIKLAILSYHPMSYHVSFYRAVEHDSRIDSTVLYLDRYGVEALYDPEFKTCVKWDVAILDGYKHKFLKNLFPASTKPLVMRTNPGILSELLFGNYDAVLITSYDTITAQMALLVSKLTGKMVIMRTEANLSKRVSGARIAIKKLLLGRIFRMCNALMYSCVSNREYFKHYAVPTEKLFPILCSVDNESYFRYGEEHPDSRARLRAAHGIPEDATVFLFSGRHVERKRPLDLLEAHARVTRDHPDAWLVTIGDGPLKEAMEDVIRTEGIERVVLVGFKNLSEIPDYYLMSDILVLASEYDPSPKSLNEAMAFGLPGIVSTGVGTANDLLMDQVNGFVYETGDVDRLTECMAKLTTDQDLRIRMSNATLEEIRKWTPEANVEGLVSALNYCIEKK